MQYTKLGNTGVTVSRLALGCMSPGGGEIPSWSPMARGWQVNREDARAHVALALETGVNFFDTADVYSVGLSEEITGHWLREKNGKSRRHCRCDEGRRADPARD